MKLFNKHIISLLLVFALLSSALPMSAFSAAADTCSDGHNYGRIVNSVAHMGYSYEAPENTLPSYRLAKEKGFFYVECDVTYTSDGVPVLHHLETIDSTSNGTGKVTQMTYNQLLKYDFGSWKNSKYVGTKIPTFEEFIALCSQLGLHPYIELKDHGNHTRESLGELVAIVEKYGMLRQCTWITFIHDYFFYINEFDPQARVGLLWPNDINSSIINKAASIKTSQNEVFLNVNYDALTDSGIQRAKSNGFPVEVYTVDDKNTMLNANSYISGFTSNYLVAQSVIGMPNATVTDPDCLRQGYTTYTCNDCGYTYRDNYVGVVDHDYDSNGVCKTCGFETEGFTYYVYDASNGGSDSNNGNSPNSPVATFDKAVQLAKNAGAGSGTTVTLNLKGNVNWGGNINSNGISTNWEVLTSHDFKVVVNSVDGAAVLGDGAKNVMLGGEIEFNNVEINAGSDWKSLVFVANSATFNNTFSSNMFDLVLGTRAAYTNDKATAFTFNNYRSKIFVGNSYKTITHNQKFTLDLASNPTGTIGNTLLVMAASDGKTVYNAGADIITSITNELTFSNADKVDIGTNGYLNIINNASQNTIDIYSIGLSDAAMAKTWVLNIDSDVTLKSTSKAGVFEVPKGYVAIADPLLGDNVTSSGGKLTISAGQHAVSITVCTNHTYDNNKDTDCNICGTVREVLPCDHKYSNACDTTCNECGEERQVPDHIYDNACDTNCNVCGNIRTITHSYKWAVDKAENCGENGTKHQECTVCGAKKDENTTIPATNVHTYTNACDTTCNVCGNTRSISHTYQNGVCTVCGFEKNHTGVQEIDGQKYLYVDGKTTRRGLYKIGDDYYFTDWGGKVYTDGRYYVHTTYCDLEGQHEYSFDKDGKMLQGIVEIDGVLYLYINGSTSVRGLFKVGEDYYFADWGGVIYTDGKYYVHTTHCDLEGRKEYTFGKDGKMLQGVVEIDGTYYLYQNGITSVRGLFKVGEDYYFADWGGVVYTDGRYYVHTTHCDLEGRQEYSFGSDGKMLQGVVEIDGTLYLYQNGSTTVRGLFKVGEDYYFADWGGVIYTDGEYYVHTSHCDLEGGKTYTFGADGKLIK